MTTAKIMMWRERRVDDLQPVLITRTQKPIGFIMIDEKRKIKVDHLILETKSGGRKQFIHSVKTI